MRRLIFTILTTLFTVCAFGAPVTIKAKLDSTQMTMGYITTLHLEVVKNKSQAGEFLIFKEAPKDGVVTLLNDTIELSTNYKRTVKDIASGREQINYEVPVQVFDSGYYRIPPLEYVAGNDTFRSNPMSLKVLPVPGLTKDSQIADYAGVVGPAESKWSDSIPDLIYDWWWVIFLGIVLLAALIVLIIMYKRRGYFVAPKPEPLPWVVALADLDALKEKKLWEQGYEREYFTSLTDILRTYMDKRFGINAMEMTTTEILDRLENDPETRDRRDYVQRVLDMADFVKFAAHKTMPADNVQSYENAVRFVQETIPQKPAEKDKDADNGYELKESDFDTDSSDKQGEGGAK